MLPGDPSWGNVSEMAIDVFISCSTRDRDVAEAIGQSLHAHGVTFCSPLAPMPGQSAKPADNKYRTVFLVFSSQANRSGRVRKEIRCAIEQQTPIVTLSVEDVPVLSPFDRLAESDYWRHGRRTSLPEHVELVVYWITMLLARLDMGSPVRTLGPVRTGSTTDMARPGSPDPSDSTVGASALS